MELSKVCKLIDIFILTWITSKFNSHNIRPYKGDRLAVFKNTSSPKSGKIKDFSIIILKQSFRYYRRMQLGNS